MTTDRMLRRKPTLQELCLAAFSLMLVILTVLPFFILCRYNHPGDNDNWLVFRAFLDKDRFRLTFADFFSFRGTVNFANLFFSPLYNHPEGMTRELFCKFISIYHFSAAFYVGILWLSLSVLFICVNKAALRFTGCKALFFYSLFIYLAFNSIHYPTMAFYDLVSSSGYNASLSYLLLFMAFSLLEYGSRGRKKLIYGFASLFFAIFCIFSMEYNPFICGCISFAFLLHSLVKRKKIHIIHLLLLVLTLLVFARNFLMVKSFVTPDEDGYVGKYTGGTDSGLTLAVSLGMMCESLKENFFRFFHQLISQRRYMPATAVLSIGAALALHRQGKKLPVLAVLPFFLIILGNAAVFSFATPDVFVMPRYAWTLFVMIFLFIICLLTSLASLALHLFDRAMEKDGSGDFASVRNGFVAARSIFFRMTSDRKLLLLITAFCSLLAVHFALKDSKSSVATAWKDILKGEAATFDRELTDRYETIFSAEKGEKIYLVPIYHRPASLYVRDSMEFELDRRCYRHFFGRDEIYFKVGDLILY